MAEEKQFLIDEQFKVNNDAIRKIVQNRNQRSWQLARNLIKKKPISSLWKRAYLGLALGACEKSHDEKWRPKIMMKKFLWMKK